MERLTPREVDDLLCQLALRSAEHADSILDLRELLLQGGHPGKCVRCFFTISHSFVNEQDAGILALRNWLERNVELAITADGCLLETIPFHPQPGVDLETYCRTAIRLVRLDRAYRQHAITIRFRYREAA